jgi:hypothetical protein
MSPIERSTGKAKRLRNQIDLRSQFSICSPERSNQTRTNLFSPSDFIRQTVTTPTMQQMVLAVYY